jgi:hypothetical protein
MPKHEGALPSLPRRLSPALPLLSPPSQARTQDFPGGPIEHRSRENRGADGCGVRGGGVPPR